AAYTNNLVTEPTYIDIAGQVDFGERQKGKVKATAVVKIELGGLLDHRREVLAPARVTPRDGRTADDPLLIGKVNRIEQPLLRRDGGNACRNTRSQIADGVWIQLHRRSAHDHLARAEWNGLDAFHRDPKLSGVARIVVSRISLTLFRIDDDEVDQNSR